MLQFGTNQHVQVRIDPTRVSLTAGFDVHRLTIWAELLPAGMEHNLLCDVEAEVYVTPPGWRWLTTAQPMRVRLRNASDGAEDVEAVALKAALADIEEPLTATWPPIAASPLPGCWAASTTW
ncbi:hypothetical protein ACJ6WF_48985 [Streptomyces sp. MMS24-I2-30]|uniref:hypothetical protein n=1 Tax=Streptomyces sp. MMS24-I2-30 TaxID=3351564 RepID=UPI003896A2CC